MTNSLEPGTCNLWASLKTPLAPSLLIIARAGDE